MKMRERNKQHENRSNGAKTRWDHMTVRERKAWQAKMAAARHPHKAKEAVAA
jgi:hypothetical protein